jgi:uncharacterized protein YjiK
MPVTPPQPDDNVPLMSCPDPGRLPLPTRRRRHPPRLRAAFAALAALAAAAAAAAFLGLAPGTTPPAGTAEPATTPPPPTEPPRYVLQADRWWPLDLPEGRRLDASGLLRLPDGAFVTVNDQDARAYRFTVTDTATSLELAHVREFPTAEDGAGPARGGASRLDLEGLARDTAGRWYVCEEAGRQVFRWDPAGNQKALHKLEIDWTPVRRYFHPTDRNASFEGIAVATHRLYLANERQTGRIIAIDLESSRIVDDFTVVPAGSVSPDTHFSDLCWADDSLWALLRDARKLLRIDPVGHRVLAEFEYGEMENADACGYGLLFAPGFMEGLWVDDRFFWLLVDNNGIGRRGKPGDRRPILFRCRRPDRPGEP